MIKLILYGEPVAKGRARTVRSKGGFSLTYTPDKTARAMQQWKEAFINSRQKPFPPDTPLSLKLRAYRSRPKTLPKRVKFPISKPDNKNILDLVEDALQGLAFKNDSNFVDTDVKKRFAVYPDPPRVEIEITEVELKEDK